ncbi:MAG TPA: histidinol dehydrogenase [Natrialbaceae archaeon]|nr:histidinol dehydrogenase [Natrialbaceae archaeon]
MDVETVSDLGPAERSAIFDRDAGVDAIREDVRTIVDRVREEGDVALREFTAEFDDVDVGAIEITDDAEQAAATVDAEIHEAIDAAARNVREFHERQVREDWREDFDGRELGRRFRPLERVGVYVPGGAAAYPSSALMGVIPAVVAGVDQVVVATPPAEEINPVTLAAIHIAGADEVYQVGGAQAIAAMAHGTETIPAVQKIVGPGNRWVTAAKAAVQGDVSIDFLAGPSEVLVVADDTADPGFVASELLVQAEHDEHAAVVAVTDDETMATAIADEVDAQLPERDRQETIEAALENDASGIFLARSMSEAILFADEFAAEHLSIQVADPETVLDRIDSAGSIFVGPHTPVAAGDYASGTNHVLPTNGLAKRHGGLSVDDFVRSTTIQRLDREGLESIGETIVTLADAEGLEAHAESVRRLLDE